MNDPCRFQNRFFRRLQGGLHLASLFDYLPEVYLYVKDRRSRFVKINEPLWQLRGFDTEADMIGLSDLDIHPQHLAEQYIWRKTAGLCASASRCRTRSGSSRGEATN